MGVPEVGNLNGVTLPWYWDFYHRYIGLGLFESLGGPGDGLIFTREILSVAAVRYVIVDRRFEEAVNRLKSMKFTEVARDELRLIFENPHQASRASLAEGIVPSEHLPHELGCAFPDTATTTSLELVSEARRMGIGTSMCGPGRKTPPGAVRVVSYDHGSVRMKAVLSRPALLVFADTWHPGWNAKINGNPASIHRVNVAFRGIPLPAGDHEITMQYAPS